MNEQELQDIVNYICEAEGCNKPQLRIKDVNGGRSGKKGITIPQWAVRISVEYAYYYTIHETVHWVGYRGHGYLFKRREQYWLAEFGIKPIYKKAYPKALLSTVSGQSFICYK